ncbi:MULTISPECIES: hypothetical protein [unclassified Streptomyces]|uniref:hypothetical protein n=1 Tax=unclassified Streptomyces TaxID=2593676 RepID=UPI0030779670
MSWTVVRLVCTALIAAEFWALYAGERQLLHLFAVLGLGVLAVAWVLRSGQAEDGEGER